MGNHGDLAAARASYEARTSDNLRFLIEQRYEWINTWIDPDAEGVELGSGIGVGREFLRCRSLLLTDFDDGEWLDVPNVDALATPFTDEQFDFVLVQNAIHHLAHPVRLFDEAARILKPGGCCSSGSRCARRCCGRWRT